MSCVLSGRGLCDELITRPEESYRLCCVVVCDLETSRRGAPYIYDISRIRVNYRFIACRLNTAKHVSGILLPIIRSLSTAAAASVLPLERGGSSAVGRGRSSMKMHGHFLLFLRWRYSPGWALASFTIRFQVSRPLAMSLNSFISIFLRSLDTSSSHLIFGLPLHLVPNSFPYIFFFGIAVSCILSI